MVTSQSPAVIEARVKRAKTRLNRARVAIEKPGGDTRAARIELKAALAEQLEASEMLHEYMRALNASIRGPAAGGNTRDG